MSFTILCECAPLSLTLCDAIVSQAPLFMALSQQENWSELPLPPPGDFPNPGIEPAYLMYILS